MYKIEIARFTAIILTVATLTLAPAFAGEERGSGGSATVTHLDDVTPIKFTLKTPGRVSLAVYDGQGRRIRELLRADDRPAGTHTVWWDGLDRDGKPQSGTFEWRLASSQGLKSEYLLSIGTSFRENHWPAQHGPLCAVAADDKRTYVTAGMSEGMPQSGAMTRDGRWQWVSGPTGGWMGGIDLAVDGEWLYFLGGPHCRDAGLFVQNSATGNMKQGLKNTNLFGGWPVEKYGQPRRVDARAGELVLASPSTGLIVWLDPATGQELDRLTVDGGLTDVALLGKGRVLAISSNDVVEVARGAATRISRIQGLTFPSRIAADPVSEQIFIVEAGTSQQLKRFSADYQLQQTFGRAGGRRMGLYHPEDFLDVTGIAGDGTGGFVVTESSAPRRTAHFDADGTLVNEWYGGQSFYTYVAPEPDRPDRLWMHSDGWLTHLKADYEAGNWRPLATYRWGDALDRRLLTGSIRNAGFGVKRLDLDGDGTKETYLWPKWSAPLLLKVDEAAGLLRPVAGMEAVPAQFAVQPLRTCVATFGEAVATGNWCLKAKAQWKIFNANQYGWIELLDKDQNVLASFYMYRGGPTPGITTDSGHATYLVFNGKEVTHQGSPEWALTGSAAPFSITLRDGIAQLIYGDPQAGEGKSITVERPLSRAGNADPTAIRLRTDQGAEISVSDATMEYPVDGQLRIVPVPLADAKWSQAVVKPVILAEALSLKGEDAEDIVARRRYRNFTWADGNNDGTIQVGEIRLATSVPGSLCVLDIDDDFNIYLRSDTANGPDYIVCSPVGRTPAGYPVWDWSQSKPGPNTPFGQTRSLWTDATGDVYQTSASNGDGYNHCWWWPATFVNATAVVKTAPDGTMLWQAGERAGRPSAPRGQMHYPINTLGVVHGCIGFADYIVNPAEFWTEDGLYVGGVFDHRADDGLHPRAYAWFRHDIALGDDFRNNLGLLQYDMLIGGNLVQCRDGQVLFFGAGWNNMPVYRVTGWDDVQRQQGSVTAPANATPAQRQGTGLRGEYFASSHFEGGAALVRTDGRIWMAGASWGDQPVSTKAETVRWTGSIEPVVSGAHTFSAYTTDSGVRLWINGRKVLDQWSTPGKYWTAPIELRAGQRCSVRIDWRRRGDKPEMHLNWEALDLPIEHIPTTALYPDVPITAANQTPIPVMMPTNGRRRFDEVLDVRNEADTLSLGINESVARWELSGRVIYTVAHGGNEARMEVLDDESKAVVVWYLYRGEAKAGITRPRGHTNYLVFNDAEVPLDDAEWRALNGEQAFTITVENGLARLTHASGFTTERPVLSGDASRPATVQVRSNAGTARVRVSDLTLKTEKRDTMSGEAQKP